MVNNLKLNNMVNVSEILQWYKVNVPLLFRQVQEREIILAFKSWIHIDNLEDSWMNDPNYTSICEIASWSAFQSDWVANLDTDKYSSLLAFFLFDCPINDRCLASRKVWTRYTMLREYADTTVIGYLIRELTGSRKLDYALPVWMTPIYEFGITRRLFLTPPIDTDASKFLWDESDIPEPTQPLDNLDHINISNAQAWAYLVAPEFMDRQAQTVEDAVWRQNEMVRLYAIDMAQPSRYINTSSTFGRELAALKGTDFYYFPDDPGSLNNRAKLAGLRLMQHIMVCKAFHYEHNRLNMLPSPEMTHLEGVTGAVSYWSPISIMFQANPAFPDANDKALGAYALNLCPWQDMMMYRAWYPAPLLGFGCLDSIIWALPHNIGDTSASADSLREPLIIDVTIAAGLVPEYLTTWLYQSRRPKVAWLDAKNSHRLFTFNPEGDKLTMMRDRLWCNSYMQRVSSVFTNHKDLDAMVGPVPQNRGYNIRTMDSPYVQSALHMAQWNSADNSTDLLVSSNIKNKYPKNRVVAPKYFNPIETMFMGPIDFKDQPVNLYVDEFQFRY